MVYETRNSHLNLEFAIGGHVKLQLAWNKFENMLF